MNFRNRFIRFMQGRNGVDSLAKFLNKLSFGCLIVAILFTFLSFVCLRHEATTASTVFRILYYVVYGIGVAILVLWLFRVFSRNVAKRQAENTRFSYRMQKIKRKTDLWKKRFKDRKTHKYFSCPKCKQIIRAPRHKGKIRVTCSNCSHIFMTKT